ncbi:MAG: pyridoxal-phosphate dependent enzyme [Clostridia bacterium]|nr:pyridoxal-phosphate dependent enzyme [Clostridia bacterium]
MHNTLIHELKSDGGNRLFIKREDLIPYSFGGNKARKAELFFQEIDGGGYDCVVTYGSSHSNHCRVVANMAAARRIRCVVIGPEEVSDETFNSRFMKLFGAQIITVPVDKVHDTIGDKLASLKSDGLNPYFIPGGGHGNIGTEAYVQCYDEIKAYESEHGVVFDYVFFASGTGTTHAGLVCGMLMRGDKKHIVGISIARANPRGRNVVIDSIKSYLDSKNLSFSDSDLENSTIFNDDYIGGGYGKDNSLIDAVIERVMNEHGIPLDSTYTAKAFYGMTDMLEKQGIDGKNILFIHTGGTPLFFDDFSRMTLI